MGRVPYFLYITTADKAINTQVETFADDKATLAVHACPQHCVTQSATTSGSNKSMAKSKQKIKINAATSAHVIFTVKKLPLFFTNADCRRKSK